MIYLWIGVAVLVASGIFIGIWFLLHKDQKAKTLEFNIGPTILK